MTNFHDNISDYRKSLLTVEQEMQTEYDKTILLLSGGALGVSMTFLTEVVVKQGVHSGGWLLVAWVCWGVSVTSTLFSYYTSAQAFRRAVQQTDDQMIYMELVGGRSNRITKYLNAAAGILFLLGVVAIVIFVARNLP